jgi:epoxide hydrolase-like predicted phosphatase
MIVKHAVIIYLMIKAVLFDYGGVITNGGVAGAVEGKFARALGISPDNAHKLLQRHLQDFVRGKVDTPMFWENIESDYGSPIPVESRDIWYEWEDISPLPEIIKLRDRIRESGFKTGILSNTEPMVGELLRSHGAYAGFDEVVLSYEVGFAKPDKEIYYTILDRFKLEPNETLFIDDRQSMLLPAEEIGMHTILATSSSQIIADATKALNLPL